MKKNRHIALLLSLLLCAALCAQPAGVLGQEATIPEALGAPATPDAATESKGDDTEQPTATLRPTLPPEGPYAVLIASLREAAQKTHISMPRALEAWLVSRVSQVDGGLEVAIPLFEGAQKVNLPVYQGEEPTQYMQDVVQKLAEAIMLLPMDADTGRIFAEQSTTANEALVEALVALGEDMEEWLDAQLLGAKAYSAMTRLVFDYKGIGKEYWANVEFAEKKQAPVYGAEQARRTFKRDDTGPSIRMAQEALIAQGYLLAERSTGIFTEQMEEAIRKFEAANGLFEDGRLSADDQYVLYGEIPPFQLPAELAQLMGRAEDIDTWWNFFVYELRAVSWHGSAVTITYPEIGPIWSGLYSYAIGYINQFSEEDHAGLIVAILGEIEKTTELESKLATIHLTLDVLRGAGGAALLSESDRQTLFDAFDTFHETVSFVYNELHTTADFDFSIPEQIRTDMANEADNTEADEKK